MYPPRGDGEGFFEQFMEILSALVNEAVPPILLPDIPPRETQETRIDQPWVVLEGVERGSYPKKRVLEVRMLIVFSQTTLRAQSSRYGQEILLKSRISHYLAL